MNGKHTEDEFIISRYLSTNHKTNQSKQTKPSNYQNANPRWKYENKHAERLFEIKIPKGRTKIDAALVCYPPNISKIQIRPKGMGLG